MHQTMRNMVAYLMVVGSVLADGPQDNVPVNVRRVPRLGIEVPDAKATELTEGLERLAKSILELRHSSDAEIVALIPDVEIYYRAVHDALEYQEFFKEQEIDNAFDVLKTGQGRAASLLKGEMPWTKQTGLVVRGYVSKIDGSAQPYGLVIPQNYSHDSPVTFRCDVWFHGRGETLSEANFITQRSTQAGQFTPANTVVLHPYGRYCNANKFAGEVDVLEALDSVKSRYRIDEDRISVRGFSMGGASCWQFAVHYADQWFAANPGAGFSETPEFLRFFQKETLNPTWFEEKLWRMYDCNLWATNLLHCPTVAYSGEDDIQKQAADIMEQALDDRGIELVHIIGSKTGHQYHPESAAEVERRLTSIAKVGRQRVPKRLDFTTYTLKYNKMHWLQIDGLEEHWEPATVTARITDDNRIDILATNVTAFTLDFPPGHFPFVGSKPIRIFVNDRGADVMRPKTDRSGNASFHWGGIGWVSGKLDGTALHKRKNLQGPIDDAFMDAFIFVRPTSKAKHTAVGEWVDAELARAIEHWRRHFRGNARVKNDTDLTDDDIASANLILWGDPTSNVVMSRVANRLPIQWTPEEIRVGSTSYSSENHVPILIYPNPLHPDRYIVFNSSFTFRDFAYLNNARQVSKLPDWAVVDVRTPADSLWPGKIVDADFFDEQWQLRVPRTSASGIR